MANEKIIMNEEMLDDVTGGTILPYRVKKGENLADVAKKYNVTVEQLMKWNNIGLHALSLSRRIRRGSDRTGRISLVAFPQKIFCKIPRLRNAQTIAVPPEI